MNTNVTHALLATIALLAGDKSGGAFERRRSRQSACYQTCPQADPGCALPVPFVYRRAR